MILIYLLFGCLGVCLFMVFRNYYTYLRMRESINLVYQYVCNLNNKDYDYKKDYYGQMIIDYDKYLLSFSLWGKYSAIKKEYKELLVNPILKKGDIK